MSDVGASPPLLLAATPLLLADRLAGRECMITLSRPKIVLVFPVPARECKVHTSWHELETTAGQCAMV